MSKVVQKLRKKLKAISQKRFVFKEGMLHRGSGKRAKRAFRGFSFCEDKYEALDQVQQILGLTDEEISGLFAIMEKADDGHLDFYLRGMANIAFYRVGFDQIYPKAINVCVDVNGEEISQSAKYTFRNGLGDLTKWKKKS